ncbi:hypothetical protein SAMN05216410_1305 [Sanguibacter gelidistatuariae]|uniref:Uncharacterized protein n=1 Tax=Sanguibacter gelidistatuariae TaxID=1814289 RepID=A0A1G6JDA8_9MICO|nr:hypothetical protein [Sanguibacter gelidistatuariae]SDC16375.1 hypothetical protein SAMN05216410_1305 [Sanguibacter gelidistatuariae]
MGWILLFYGVVLACLVIALRFAPHGTVPVRHARRGMSSPRPRGRHAFAAAPRHVDDDPFEVLALQCRLTALAAEIQRLGRDRTTFALAHHLRATQYAYDALLAEACTLVGLTTEAWDPTIPDETSGSWTVDEDTRMRKELELSARGWTW